MCNFCSDSYLHKIDEKNDNQIAITEDQMLCYYNKFDILLSAFPIKYCPICGKYLDYRFDVEFNVPIDKVKKTIKYLENVIDDILRSNDVNQIAKVPYYLGKCNGLREAIHELKE
jgi:hypothetical protein